jgi:A/G-specific adenine glycosylase
MLQQTRTEAVIPYFHRFLARFPDIRALAEASEPDVLAAWSGLGYYSRARNLHRAARQIAANGIPATHDRVLALPGAGPYTAAAVSSIALGLPHAAVDGNVIRVLSRLTSDASEISLPRVRAGFGAEAQRLLDRRRPGDFNQAMMELGATVCLPRNPACQTCPVLRFCAGRAAGRERELPVKAKKPAVSETALDLLALFRASQVFLIRRGDTEKRMSGFWELPRLDLFPNAAARKVSEFTHRIVNDRFRVTVRTAGDQVPAGPPGRWFGPAELDSVPVTTITRKALAVVAAKSVPARKRAESIKVKAI